MERFWMTTRGLEPNELGAWVRYVDVQRAINAARADNRAYINERHEHMKTIEKLTVQLATLQAQLADEQQRADRAVKDRSEVLDVKTKEGLSCSEWLMRTATAERKVKGLQAQLRQVEGENARLKEALVAVVKLVDDGLLVRNVANDHMEGWGIRALPIVQALQQANEALQPKRGGAK